jgi:hypothetical protein
MPNCFCDKIITNDWCVNPEFEELCNVEQMPRKTTTCPDAAATLARINGTVRQASSLNMMVKTAKCAVTVKSGKNASYQRVLFKRKKCLN